MRARPAGCSSQKRPPRCSTSASCDEWQEGHIPGAVHIPRGYLESQIEQALPDREQPVDRLLRGRLALGLRREDAWRARLRARLRLAGGYTDWKRNGFPTDLPRSLDTDKRSRYSRHLLIPEVGEEGQLKLLDSRMLLIGAGGLGSPASLYLAAAGVGTLGIVDADVVDADEPAAPDRPLDRLASASPKADSAQADDRGAQPRRRRSPVPGAAHLRERRPDPRRGLGRDRRRRRQLPDALPPERRVGLARHPGRARLDLPLRGPGHRLQARTRARATAASSRSRRRPSSRRAAPRAACSASCRASSARCRRTRRSSSRSASASRSIGRLLLFDALAPDVQRGQAPPRPGLPRLRRVRRRSPSTSTTSSSARDARPGCTDGDRPHPAHAAHRRRAARARSRPPAAPSATLLDDLTSATPRLRGQLFENGEIAPFVNVYVEGEDVRTLDGLETPVAEGIDRDPAAGHGRRLEQRVDLAPLAARPRRAHAARRAAAALARRRRPDLREARGPEPDRLDQGPRRQGDDRGRRGVGRARSRAASCSSPRAATPASRSPSSPSSRATG